MPETVTSILPARVLTLALAAALLLSADARAEPTGGFSAGAPVGTVALNADGRTASAPPDAPQEVVDAVAAANRITRKPYKWGGGHGRWRDSGYDCSGTVSYVLHAAGLILRARDSTGLTSYGSRGKGDWITIYANAGHTYMTIAGLRFDTSGRGEEGPRWRAQRRSRRGYVARHPAGF